MSTYQLVEAISQYVGNRYKDRLEKEKLLDDPGTSLSEEQRLRKELLSEKYEISNWIADAATRAKQISICTHPAKFSHPDSKATSVNDRSIGSRAESQDYYLTSASLKSFSKDVSGNAAALDVAKFLLLEVAEGSLIERLQQGVLDDLLPFAESREQAEEWRLKFLQAVEVVSPAADALSKQIYFPIDSVEDENHYHLLCPLYASSLAVELLKRVETVRYGEEAKVIREAKRQARYHEKQEVSYPRTSKQNFGGTKPQNISMLNTSKGFPLLNSEPPAWKGSEGIKALKYRNSLWRLLAQRSRDPLKALRGFIFRNRNRDSDFNLREERKDLVDSIVDIFIQIVIEARTSLPAGWSKESSLRLSEKTLLDPLGNLGSSDETQEETDWEREVGENFASWFNKQLEIKKYNIVLADDHYNEWRKLMLKELSYFKEQ